MNAPPFPSLSHAVKPLRMGLRAILVTGRERELAAQWVRDWRSLYRSRPQWPRLTLSEVRRRLFERFA